MWFDKFSYPNAETDRGNVDPRLEIMLSNDVSLLKESGFEKGMRDEDR